MGRVPKWTSTLVFLLGLPRPLFADATLPIAAQPAPPTCGDARARSLYRLLKAYCARNSDPEDVCSSLLRGFRRCEVGFWIEWDGRIIANVNLPSQEVCWERWAEATFDGEGRTLRVVEVAARGTNELCDP